MYVDELYGSLRASYSHLPTARPDFRLEHRDWAYLTTYVESCHKYGLKFNYTMNAPQIGALSTISNDYNEIVKSLKILESIGVDRVTVSHPILMQMVCNHTSLPIEVSTIMNVNSLQAPASLKAKYDTICASVDMVRNYTWCKEMTEVCGDLGIELQMMVSEFCMSTNNASCTQTLRNSCYQMHGYNMPQDEAQKGMNPDGSKQQQELKGFPWTQKNGRVFGRANDAVMWMTSRTIFPNDIKRYIELTNVPKIKVTTRTAPAHYALFLTECYMKGKYDGLLAGLWLQLQLSTNDKRQDKEKFDEMQAKLSKVTPFTCAQLSKAQWIYDVHIPEYGIAEAVFHPFMYIFEALPFVDWNQVIWVDKEAKDCKPYECNWAHKWYKAMLKDKSCNR